MPGMERRAPIKQLRLQRDRGLSAMGHQRIVVFFRKNPVSDIFRR